MTEVSAKIAEGDEITIDYALPDGPANEEDGERALAALVERFGAHIVAAHCRASVVVSLQGYVRGLMRADKSEDDITEAVASWLPSTRKPGKSDAEKATELFGKLTPEERDALLEQLTA